MTANVSRLYVPSKGRPHSVQKNTLALFPDATLVLHTEDEAGSYRDAGVTAPVIVSGKPYMPGAGKAHSIQHVLDNCIEDGQWAAFADDDIYSLTRLADPWYSQPRYDYGSVPKAVTAERYETDASGELRGILQEIADHAQGCGASLAGPTQSQNVYFRTGKWGYVVLPSGCLFLVRKVPGLRVPQNEMEDNALAIERLVADGCNVLNRYVCVGHGAHQAGGHGLPTGIRRKHREKALRRYLRRYRGLVKPIMFDGLPGFALAVSNRKRLDNWRREHGYIE